MINWVACPECGSKAYEILTLTRQTPTAYTAIDSQFNCMACGYSNSLRGEKMAGALAGAAEEIAAREIEIGRGIAEALNRGEEPAGNGTKPAPEKTRKKRAVREKVETVRPREAIIFLETVADGLAANGFHLVGPEGQVPPSATRFGWTVERDEATGGMRFVPHGEAIGYYQDGIVYLNNRRAYKAVEAWRKGIGKSRFYAGPDTMRTQLVPYMAVGKDGHPVRYYCEGGHTHTVWSFYDHVILNSRRRKTGVAGGFTRHYRDEAAQKAAEAGYIVSEIAPLAGEQAQIATDAA